MRGIGDFIGDFIHFSVKDLINFSKNSKDTGPVYRSRKFTRYFYRKKKKRFMQHPQFLLPKRYLSEHLQKW